MPLVSRGVGRDSDPRSKVEGELHLKLHACTHVHIYKSVNQVVRG